LNHGATIEAVCRKLEVGAQYLNPDLLQGLERIARVGYALAADHTNAGVVEHDAATDGID